MRKILIIITALIAYMSLYSEIVEEKENSIMEVYYTKITEKDTIQRNEHLEISPMTLRIGQTASMFFGTKKFWADSLKTYDFNTLMEIRTARRESGAPDWWRPLGGSEWEYIFKNMPEGMLTGSCLFDQELRYYEEEWQKPTWQILDSTKTVLGFECIKATTDYRGRTWIAWFTPEIAVQDGPWKLCGLPGLILEAYDTKRHYQFLGTGIVYTTQLKVGRYFFKVSPPLKMTRDKYFQHRHWYINERAEDMLERQQQLAIMAGLEPPRTVDDLNIDTSFYVKRDFEETDYPHKWRIRDKKL